jgi:hypothetical protein
VYTGLQVAEVQQAKRVAFGRSKSQHNNVVLASPKGRWAKRAQSSPVLHPISEHPFSTRGSLMGFPRSFACRKDNGAITVEDVVSS